MTSDQICKRSQTQEEDDTREQIDAIWEVALQLAEIKELLLRQHMAQRLK